MREDLDFTWGDEEPEPTPQRDYTPFKPVPRDTKKAGWAVLVILVLVAAAVMLVGADTISKRNDAITALEEENAELLDQWAEAVVERAEVAQELREATTTITALRSEVATLNADLDTLATELESARVKAARSAATVTPTVSRSAPAVSRPTTGTTWSRAQVEAALTAAAKSQGLSEAQTAWVVSTGARIAYKESTYRTDVRNGQHLGLFQFNAAWGSDEQRLDPHWSCARFVQAYREGGEANIRKHWKATF